MQTASAITRESVHGLTDATHAVTPPLDATSAAEILDLVAVACRSISDGSAVTTAGEEIERKGSLQAL